MAIRNYGRGVKYIGYSCCNIEMDVRLYIIVARDIVRSESAS